jgi:sugar phosphate isomerase/epimerase
MNTNLSDMEMGSRLLRLTLSTYAWVDLPVVEPFEKLASLGINRLQLFWKDGHFSGTEVEIATLEEECAKNRIKIESVHAPFWDFDLATEDEALARKSMETCESAIKLAGRLGARRVVVHPRSELINAADEVHAIQRLSERMALLRRVARRNAVYICLENILGNDLGGLCDKLALLDHDCFCLDLGHAHFNDDMAGATAHFGDRLSMVHIHDNDGESDSHLMPGMGSIDWAAVEKNLLESGFDGEYCIEVSRDQGLDKILGYYIETMRNNRIYVVKTA